jgi:hypothetical protein
VHRRVHCCEWLGEVAKLELLADLSGDDTPIVVGEMMDNVSSVDDGAKVSAVKRPKSLTKPDEN